MGYLFDLQVGLESRLNEISNKPYVQWENDQTYKPTIGTRFWRTTVLPNRTEGASIDPQGAQRHTGIFQVDVFVPLNEGLADCMQDLDQIFDKYPISDTIIVGNTRINITSVGRGRVEREKSWLHGFIEVQYKMYSYVN